MVTRYTKVHAVKGPLSPLTTANAEGARHEWTATGDISDSICNLGDQVGESSRTEDMSKPSKGPGLFMAAVGAQCSRTGSQESKETSRHLLQAFQEAVADRPLIMLPVSSIRANA
jgi:hypothetical protein